MLEQKKILIVDDDPFILKMIKTALVREGYAIIMAENGEEGLEAIKTQGPHLVLCDRSMPKLSGYNLLETIRSTYPEHNDIPFIFLTSLGDRRDRLATASLSPTSYLTKPVDLDELLSVVKSSLDS